MTDAAYEIFSYNANAESIKHSQFPLETLTVNKAITLGFMWGNRRQITGFMLSPISKATHVYTRRD